MKRGLLLVALALALTIAFASSAFATTGKFYAHSTSYYTWTTPTVSPGTTAPAGVSLVGSNTVLPGPHANYIATTAKCGMCHSVHRAAGDGVKLLPTADATCGGCHTGGTAITTKIVTWTPYDVNWTPVLSVTATVGAIGDADWALLTPKQKVASIGNTKAAGGAANGGGPHNDSAVDLIADGIWDGTGATPEASYEPGHRYGCFTRRCHAMNPHGANSSAYPMFASKLLFNESADADQEGDGTYGGLDAVWDAYGATDAAVGRFVAANASIMSTTPAGEILINGAAPDEAETHALVAGLTCGRPSNVPTGEDECHAEASYAIVDKGIKEERNHATGLVSPSSMRTDNTGDEAPGMGGNDNRDWKTAHVAGTFAAVPGSGSYAPISGCTSCHDQTDAANGVAGNFTFPHGQTATGASNLTSDGVAASYTGRARIWMGYSGGVGKALLPVKDTSMKAYDGNCLKCHRDGAGEGIGLTK